jgi:multidrug efflux pump subunit AcrA (membrane-fusion protein)
VKISIVGTTIAQAWKVPDSAIVTADDGAKSVLVVGSDGATHRKSVTLGIDDGKDVQIVSGVAPTDLVITVAPYGLDEGTKVQVSAAAPADGGE